MTIHTYKDTSGQSRVYRVTQLRTDGVHCRESADTGPVNLKVVPNECGLASAIKTRRREPERDGKIPTDYKQDGNIAVGGIGSLFIAR